MKPFVNSVSVSGKGFKGTPACYNYSIKTKWGRRSVRIGKLNGCAENVTVKHTVNTMYCKVIAVSVVGEGCVLTIHVSTIVSLVVGVHGAPVVYKKGIVKFVVYLGETTYTHHRCTFD